MDIDFVDEKDGFLVIYFDDITMYSKFDEDHLQHLRIVFEKCRKYGISLNPKKSLFGMEKGKMLGHIISKDGIRIDPLKIKAIQKVDIPRNKKEIHSFLGRINFLRRFIPNLAEIIRFISNMLKKYIEIKWTEEAINSFNEVKFSLSLAPILINPYYTQDFIVFTFSSEHSISTV